MQTQLNTLNQLAAKEQCEELQCGLDVPSQCAAALSLLAATTWNASIPACDLEASICRWTGVTCGGSSGGDIVKLDWRGLRLSGTIPDVFWALPGLTHLDLSSNSFSGALPASVCSLRLAYVNVSASGLTLPACLAPPPPASCPCSSICGAHSAEWSCASPPSPLPSIGRRLATLCSLSGTQTFGPGFGPPCTCNAGWSGTYCDQNPSPPPPRPACCS